MATLEKAILLAAEAHRGQVDKAGQPYILHPLRVMFLVDSEVARIAAVLHDVVEDTVWTIEKLRTAGFSDEVLQAVRALTRDAEESYEEFARRASLNPIAREVKLADLRDNMDVRRLNSMTERDFERLKRYRVAWEILSNIEPS